jgi:hypothetical protein
VVASPGLDIASKFFDIGDEYLDQAVNAVFGSRDDLKRLFGNTGMQLIQISLDPAIGDEEAMKELRKAGGFEVIAAGSGRQIKGEISGFLKGSLLVSSVVAVCAMLVACFGVANLFVAGGVGIAPIMGMLRTLEERGERRPLWLVYGNDRWEDVLFREELVALEPRLDLDVVHVLRQPEEQWGGERGLVTREVLVRSLPPALQGTECFLCGPEPMTDAVQEALQELGIPRRHVHVELFDMV